MGTVIEFEYTPEFLKSAKILSKRYRSFPSDLKELIKDISSNPKIGIDLGNGLRKLRMSIKSKGKGKSGGARIITLTLITDASLSKIVLLYVYDKSDISNISDSQILQIMSNNNLKL